MNTKSKQSLIKSFEKGQGKDTEIKVTFQVAETTLRNVSFEPKKVVINTNDFTIEDKDGKIGRTFLREDYIVTIENGVISFNKPLNLRGYGKI